MFGRLCAFMVPLVFMLTAACGGKAHDWPDVDAAVVADAPNTGARDAASPDSRVGDTGELNDRIGAYDDARAGESERSDASLPIADVGPERVDAGATLRDAGSAQDARVTSLMITPGQSTAEPGTVIRVVVTAVYADGSTADVTQLVSLVSSHPTVVQIASRNGAPSGGVATARAAGTATITATLNGAVATSEVTVSASISGIVSIALTVVGDRRPLADEHCFIQNTVRFRAIATMSNGATRDVTGNVTWASSDRAIILAPPPQQGGATFQCLSDGEAVISVVVGDVRGETTAVVRGGAVVDYILSGPAVLAPATTGQYRVLPLYDNGRLGALGLPATVIASDPAVLAVAPYNDRSINPTSSAQALATGSTVLSASFEGVQVPSLKVTVTSAALQSIALTPASLDVTLPASGRLTVIGTYTDGTKADLTTTATWSASDSLPFNHGTFVPRGTGQVSVTATSEGITSAPALINVRAGRPMSIDVDVVRVREGFSSRLSAGASYPLYRTYDISNDVMWQLSDPALATVVGSLLSAQKAGMTVYSASFAGVTSPAKELHVIDHAALLSLEFSEPDLRFASVDATTRMGLHGTFADGLEDFETNHVTLDGVFTVGNPQVVTVSNDAATRGFLRAVGIGTTTVTAVVHGVSATTTVTVGATPP